MIEAIKKLIPSAAAALLAGTIVALAANTTFFTSIGDQVFPFTAPTTNPAAPGLIDNMTIGATTPAAVNATTLSASGAVTGTGFTNRLAAPGPIGNTTPSTGAFTSLTASGQITSTAGLPTIASGACGATSNGAVVAGSTNQSGNITIGAAATTTCTVSFSATLASAPKSCQIEPTNAAAAAQGTTVAYVSSVTTAGFVITGTALANANYGFLCL